MPSWWDHLECGVFLVSVTSASAGYTWQLQEFNQKLAEITQIDAISLDNLNQAWHNQLFTKLQACWQGQHSISFLLERENLCIKLAPDLQNNLIVGSCYLLNFCKRLNRPPLAIRQNFNEVMNDFSDAIVVVDKDGYVVYVNRAAEVLFNRSAEELQGELFGMPIVAGEKTDVDIIRKGGQTASAELRIKETVGTDQMVYVIASLHDITERKRVEQSLRLQERAIASSANGIVITDALQKDNPIIYVNPAFERITGYSAQEVIGKNCRFLQRNDNQQPGLEILRQAIKEGRECHVTLSNYRKDGTQFWNRLYIAPVFNEQGEITNFVGVQTDITAEIERERQLQQSEERLRIVLMSMRQGVTFSDRFGRFSIFNPEMERLTGYTMAEANASSDFMRLIYPDPADYDQAMQRLQQLEHKKMITCETKIRSRDGEYHFVDVSSLMLEYDGQPMYLSVYHDITERKRTENQLRRQNELERLLSSITLRIQKELDIDQILAVTVEETRKLLDTDRVGIYQFDPDWNGAFVVESARAPELSMLHRTVYDSCFRDHYLNRYLAGHISYINDVENSPVIADCYKKLLAEFNVKANIVAPIIFSDKLWGLLIAHHCQSPRNWEAFEIELFQQITNHVAIALQQAELNKNLENQVAERTRQLEASLAELEKALAREKELGELKSRFISMTSHEFRTPLATIQAASDLLKNYGDKMPKEKRLDRLNKIQREVRKMTGLLEEVLTMGKAGAGKLVVRPQPLDIAHFARECLDQAELVATPEHHLILQNHCDPNWIFYADPQLLAQAVTNLLINAIKYSPKGGDITLYLSSNHDQLTIKISDHGIGIPAQELPHIFESFYRAKNVGNISGTGLGLAIAHTVVDLHHGKIEVESTEGSGTTFTVYIPNQR
ncbi:MAG: PAS domain S-box protein [Pseudanabaenaceae cyanobacterium]